MYSQSRWYHLEPGQLERTPPPEGVGGHPSTPKSSTGPSSTRTIRSWSWLLAYLPLGPHPGPWGRRGAQSRWRSQGARCAAVWGAEFFGPGRTLTRPASPPAPPAAVLGVALEASKGSGKGEGFLGSQKGTGEGVQKLRVPTRLPSSWPSGFSHNAPPPLCTPFSSPRRPCFPSLLHPGSASLCPGPSGFPQLAQSARPSQPALARPPTAGQLRC